MAIAEETTVSEKWDRLENILQTGNEVLGQKREKNRESCFNDECHKERKEWRKARKILHQNGSILEDEEENNWNGTELRAKKKLYARNALQTKNIFVKT